MNSALPHYLLHTEAVRSGHGPSRWRFSLQAVGESDRLTAADSESNTRRSRLELLAVVRGLEALDRPSRVTLLTRSRYVSQGIRRQLSHWREHHWQWERFGSMAPIRDYDLWRRIDRALEFHSVECCVWQAEEAPARKMHNGSNAETTAWNLSATLAKVRRGVLTPLTHLWRPSFTRAA
ncbi:MAG TPA: RNase H family protein [Lacipirellulaceae bacterium]|nr:RNase H family protein [Lacipirellulaceae bacterium]